MQRESVRQRTNHSQAIHDPRNPGQVVAYLDPWHAGANRFHLALDLNRSQWLGVECLVLRW